MTTRPTAVLTLFVCVTLLSHSAVAQYVQQGPKLVGKDVVGQAEEGTSVWLSGDGNTAIVGAPADAVNGAAFIWIRSAGIWTQQGNKLVSVDASSGGQGFSVALSADGNTAIVGAPYGNIGAAWVWTRTGGAWTQQGGKLVGSGAISGVSIVDEQGSAVALSADGSTAIVGGLGDNSRVGAAWIWTRSGGVWSQQGNKLVGSNAVGGSWQGSSVYLSADGNTAIVGGYQDNVGVGAAWVWTRSGGVWTQQGNKLVGAGSAAFSEQGSGVALSADGNTAIVGGFNDNGAVGATWVWTRSLGVWTQQGNKLVSSIGVFGHAEQGTSVSLSADGNTAIIGGSANNGNFGASWIWVRSGGIWTEKTRLASFDTDGFPSQGYSTSLSADGKTALVGGFLDNELVGAAWVFAVAADMGITKTLNTDPPFAAGANLSYTISVVNNGPSPASDVVIADLLPAGATFVSATPTQGSCSGTATVNCALGDLANGSTATVSLVLKTPSTPGPVSNTGTVTASETDPNPANNSFVSSITTVDPALIPAASASVLFAIAGMLAVVGIMRSSVSQA